MSKRSRSHQLPRTSSSELGRDDAHQVVAELEFATNAWCIEGVSEIPGTIAIRPDGSLDLSPEFEAWLDDTAKAASAIPKVAPQQEFVRTESVRKAG
jgi:hypothetical protein